MLRPEQVSIWGSYGRDEARAPDLPFENAWKRWCNRSVHFFRSKKNSTPTVTSSNVVGELRWRYRKGMLGSTNPVHSTIFPLAFLRCTGQPCVHIGTPTMALESNTDIYKAADSTYIPPPVDGPGETMAEPAVPQGNFTRRALLKLSPLGAIIMM